MSEVSYKSECSQRRNNTRNYIYCFPGEIEVEKKRYRCPMEVFAMKSTVEFKTARQRHVPQLVARSAENEFAIEAAHAGHFRDDSDVVNYLAMFDALREARKKLLNLTNEV